MRALDGVDVDLPPRPFTADPGPVRLRQVHAHALHGGPGHPDSGTVVSTASRSPALDDKALTTLRRDRVGFVFQSFNLAADADGDGEHHAAARPRRPQARPDWFDTRVDTVGLGDRLSHRPAELSGGQQQRVASPARSSPGPPSSSPTSPPATSTPAPAPRSSLPAPRRRRVRPDDRHGDPRPGGGRRTRTGACSWRTARSSTR